MNWMYIVQSKVRGDVLAEDWTQRWKMEAEKWEDKVKKNQEAITNLKKKREQYEGES